MNGSFIARSSGLLTIVIPKVEHVLEQEVALSYSIYRNVRQSLPGTTSYTGLQYRLAILIQLRMVGFFGHLFGCKHGMQARTWTSIMVLDLNCWQCAHALKYMYGLARPGFDLQPESKHIYGKSIHVK
jgi:hypothetical protein